MKKFHMMLGFAAITTIGTAAFAGGGRGGWKADTNQDGKVTLDEALAAAKARFDKRDTNKDGALTKDEIGKRAQWIFEKADTNKDGKITAAERDAGVRAMFAAKDTNKDGTLTKDEFKRGHGKKHKHHKQDEKA